MAQFVRFASSRYLPQARVDTLRKISLHFDSRVSFISVTFVEKKNLINFDNKYIHIYVYVIYIYMYIFRNFPKKKVYYGSVFSVAPSFSLLRTSTDTRVT